MNIRFLTKFGIILGSVFVGLFILFLTLPLILNIVIDKYIPTITGEINKLTGLSAGIEDIKIVTTPKLTAGLKVGKFELYTPQKEPVFISNNFQVKMSLLPILAKKIRIDTVQADNAEIYIQIEPDGSFLVEKFIPKQTLEEEPASNQTYSLPFGLKLSNHLPDIHIGMYKLVVADGKDTYILSGKKTDVTNFVFNKSIKISACGKAVLKEHEQFNFDIKLFNKIMPDIDLNEFVFNPQPNEKKENNTKIDVITTLRGLYEYNVTADAKVNLKVEADKIDGNVNLSNVSIINLPKSSAELVFKGNSININSDIYTAINEISKVNGQITTGKNPYIDMNIKSNVESANILNIVQKIALIFNIKDLQTLTAEGIINADFNIKSNLKTVKSSGFLKIPNAKLYYGIYKLGIDNINADVSLDNNNVNIKKVSFSTLGQPLKLTGTITGDAVSNLRLTADRLDLKGLLIAIGQASLMKDNQVNSGFVSMDVLIKGKLDKINPIIKLNLADINIKNKPTDFTLKVPSTIINITSDGKTFEGTAQANNVWLINPMAKISAPKISANIKEKSIEIYPIPVKIEKNSTVISGTINDYLTEKINLDFKSVGDIKSALTGYLNPYKMTLNLNYATTELSTIIIPMFDKSQLSFRGKINISGDMMNPIISGQASVPLVSIPEIPVTMRDMDIKLFDTILHGSGTVRSFASGEIKAENLISDFVLKGNDFYLNNLKGNSFGGKIKGNIIYNLVNAKTTVEMSGEGMNAEKAIEGASGIKKTLTGALDFNTKLNLTVLPKYNDMLKTVKGNINFNIKNGAFGSIGRFEGLLNANNIMTNVLLKNTIASISNSTGLATTGQFDSLNGKLTLSEGYANLNPVKSAGKSLCYYVTGKYNLINGSTNVAILGRLDAPMVSKLGVLGELSAEKIIGKFGAAILKIITTNPQGEKTSEIPALTNGSTNYKDFKVTFNGGIDSPSSVKSFKWLSNPDMSEVETKTVKETVQDIKKSFDKDVKTTVSNVTNSIETQKQKIQDTKQNFQDSAEELKNLFKSFKQPAKTGAKGVNGVNGVNSTGVNQTGVNQTGAEQTETVETTSPAMKIIPALEAD